MIVDACWPCICGLHEECYAPEMVDEDNLEDVWLRCCCHGAKAEDDAKAFANGPGRPMLDPDQITDKLSTGRKRARMLYPILDGMTCQWAGLKYAGGGVEPIIGCGGNKIIAAKGSSETGHRHHGPDKNVINNSPGNVHLICSTCHNRWHALNNKYYEGERPEAGEEWLPNGEWRPHDPMTQATEEEIEANEAFWAVKKDRRKEPVDNHED